MKPKKISKKLSFSKSTIANLSATELREAKGAGTTGPGYTGPCYTCDFTCPTCCPATCDDLTCYHHYGTACDN
jgi:hypothetical protein